MNQPDKWEQAMAAMREDEDMRAGKEAAMEKQDAENYRYMGEMNPLKHKLPDVMRAEQRAADKVRREAAR
jgi:hypothetical protein